MTNEQILEKQVEALEKLLQLKEAVIQELEAKVTKLQYPPYQQGLGGVPYYGGYGQGGAGGVLLGQPAISIPSVWTTTPGWQCTDGQPHTYPQNWGGTTSPPCTKCGCQTYPQSGVTTTFTNQPAQPGQSLTMSADGITQWTSGAGVSSLTGNVSASGNSTPAAHNNVRTLTNAANK